MKLHDIMLVIICRLWSLLSIFVLSGQYIPTFSEILIINVDWNWFALNLVSEIAFLSWPAYVVKNGAPVTDIGLILKFQVYAWLVSNVSGLYYCLCDLRYQQSKSKWRLCTAVGAWLGLLRSLMTRALRCLLPGVIWWAGSPEIKIQAVYSLHLVWRPYAV